MPSRRSSSLICASRANNWPRSDVVSAAWRSDSGGMRNHGWSCMCCGSAGTKLCDIPALAVAARASKQADAWLAFASWPMVPCSARFGIDETVDDIPCWRNMGWVTVRHSFLAPPPSPWQGTTPAEGGIDIGKIIADDGVDKGTGAVDGECTTEGAMISAFPAKSTARSACAPGAVNSGISSESTPSTTISVFASANSETYMRSITSNAESPSTLPLSASASSPRADGEAELLESATSTDGAGVTCVCIWAQA
mmetsp:Transcript_48330/g.134995  ORF Transcript_48330/g.134995 Transcript_48330/m.134995 type:complete len:253 (+) Transcript_48330:849-1607(+)